jgi:hypothetical protein
MRLKTGPGIICVICHRPWEVSILSDREESLRQLAQHIVIRDELIFGEVILDIVERTRIPQAASLYENRWTSPAHRKSIQKC